VEESETGMIESVVRCYQSPFVNHIKSEGLYTPATDCQQHERDAKFSKRCATLTQKNIQSTVNQPVASPNDNSSAESHRNAPTF